MWGDLSHDLSPALKVETRDHVPLIHSAFQETFTRTSDCLVKSQNEKLASLEGVPTFVKLGGFI